ncbi:Universal stress protein family [Rhodovulum sp. P5]|uniref:universal stress protein n=1 Tax=Rhodovulum sp. P5 TaxID=1564506 RepID=UPI0009C3A29F|nr:universal stress protein [Rhodovulum sp. P5]ARE40748.1 Universal stress protein family [Rhodovulum sp. P5]
MKILVGLDGHETGEKALAHAKRLAAAMEGCTLLAAFVIEWSPYTFQTPEENAQRHKRRLEEIAAAQERIVAPVVEKLKSEGFESTGLVHHGDVADTLHRLAEENGADLIVVGRASKGGFSQRLFGSSSVNLAMHSKIPVTVVG